jgi:hypothetical protein
VKLSTGDKIELGMDVVAVVETLVRVMKKDDDGKVRVTKDELKELARAATALGTGLALASLRR